MLKTTQAENRQEHNDQCMTKGLRSQLKEFPMAKARMTWAKKKKVTLVYNPKYTVKYPCVHTDINEWLNK